MANIVLTYWIQSGQPPIQLPHHVDTYPRLQLSSVDLLVTEFQLHTSSLFDLWEDNQWKIIRTSTVIMVEKDRKVLLRLRVSLREGLCLDDCPGIEEELAQQPRAMGTKRASQVDLVSPLKKVAKMNDNSNARHTQYISAAGPSTVTLNSPTTQPVSPTPVIDLTVEHSATIHPSPAVSPPSQPILSILEMPLSVWEAGWTKIARMIDEDSKVVEREAFSLVFGFKYSKASVAKYKGMWKRAPEDLRTAFIKLGNVKEGSWRVFTTALKNPESWTSSAINPTNTDPTPIKTKAACANAPALSAASPVLAVTESLPGLNTIPPAPFPELSPLLDKEPYSALEAITSYSSSDSDDETDHDQALCPFCDRPLPANPSCGLIQKLETLKSMSWPAPTPTNPAHRQTKSFTVYIDVCQRHTFETDQLPIARLAGWPIEPDFAGLFDRILRRRPTLSELIAVPEMSALFLQSTAYYRPGPSRLMGISSQYSSARFTKQGAG